MKFKKKTKFISLFLVMPFTMVCPLSISSCNNTPATEDALIIKDPTSKHGEDDIQDDKSANILLPFFSYNIPIDQKKLTVSGSFSYGEAEFKYSIVDFDIFNKTFSVLINIQKIQVVEHLIGKIFFKYNNVDVTSELADFDLSVNPVKSIKLPEVKESLTQIKSGNASVKFQGFQANGIKNVNEILVSFTGTPTLGKVEKCTITDVSNNNFSVAISFSGVAAETIDGYFQFFYESSQVSAPKDNFSCTLLVESGQPDFETDS
ncbi:MAG: hypothetical protein MJ200_04155 [Mycoplasmoidaceae bacterium]|nr:hypothetical protein [Mycoplasmoidaceae bacterium]